MTRGRSPLARLARGYTRIAARLLLFNVLLVFLPVAGLLYLDAYERHLLEQQERAMVDSGRVLAAALSLVPFDGPGATALTSRLTTNTDARFRVLAPGGRVLADTHAAGGDAPVDPVDAVSPRGRDEVRSSWLYRSGATLGRAVRRLVVDAPTVSTAETIVVAPNLISAPEVDAALGGSYGATTRLSPGEQRSVTLYSALPVRQQGQVVGAVLVSQSTWRILQRLYDVRLRMFSVVIVSLAFAVLLMAVASFTIVTPLRRLRDDAESLADRRGRLMRRFRGTERSDEIGELARALDDLTRRLEAQLRFTEQFSADVTHEFRNPLASIRASAEMLADAEQPEDRERFRARIERDIHRLETLLHGVRDLTFVDTQLEEEPRSDIDLRPIIGECASDRSVPCVLSLPDEPLMVEASGERLSQILRNLVDNAESFSPPGAQIDITASESRGQVIVRIRDHGPGIAEEHLTRIFDRFFCHRPGQQDSRQRHSGLGLSIALTIARSHGGDIRASNHPEDGAILELVMPAAAR